MLEGNFSVQKSAKETFKTDILLGWYCRATKAAEDEMGTSNNASVDNNHGSESYKAKYRELKKKLKYLLYVSTPCHVLLTH